MEASPVTDVKISSVVPASLTGENKPRHLTAMDLAVKLHYVQAVYFFKGTRDFTIPDLKNITFPQLDLQCYDHVTGRIRIPDNDPFMAVRNFLQKAYPLSMHLVYHFMAVRKFQSLVVSEQNKLSLIFLLGFVSVVLPQEDLAKLKVEGNHMIM